MTVNFLWVMHMLTAPEKDSLMCGGSDSAWLASSLCLPSNFSGIKHESKPKSIQLKDSDGKTLGQVLNSVGFQ